jgi:hypothetical protein
MKRGPALTCQLAIQASARADLLDGHEHPVFVWIVQLAEESESCFFPKALTSEALPTSGPLLAGIESVWSAEEDLRWQVAA